MYSYPPSSKLFAIVLGAALAAGLGLATRAAPPPPPAPPDIPVTYPSSLERQELVGWLKRETDIPPQSVVAVSPSTLTAIMSSRVMINPPGYSVALRAEALSPELFAREHMLSWNTAVDVDCKNKRLRQGPTVGYGVRNLLYAGKPVRPADPDWMVAPPGSVIESVWRAVCDPGFQRPFAAPGAAVVQAEPPPAAPPTATARPAPAKPAPAKRAATAAAAKPAPALRALTLRPTATPPAAQPEAPAGAGRIAVQVAAVVSQPEADRTLAALRSRFPEQMGPRGTRISQAVVGGKTWYRALVQGFATPAEAQAFCGALKATGQACFVRRD